jgi:hypothetical protein
MSIMMGFGLSRTVLSDPSMRHEYDMQGNYGLQDYNYTVSNNPIISFNLSWLWSIIS